MAKKNSTLGKLIAFTTAVAAIGGVCYIFKDKIKENPMFKSASDKANDIFDSVKSKINADDDFIFDDDFDNYDPTSEEPVSREYTTLTSSAGSENTNIPSETTNDNDVDDTENIPTIDFGSNTFQKDSGDVPTAYENEGLSDTYEDPDVLEDQDKLDF